jgi:simple sugar transport system permease protein
VTVIAIGVSISLTIGGFDLSVGSTASLANALVISLFVWHGFGTTEAILITLALCTLVGLFNAFLIVVLRIPDMLATLASLFVIQGVAMTYSYGGSITENMVLPSGDGGRHHPGGVQPLGQVPTIVIIMLVVTWSRSWRCRSPPTDGGCTPSAATRKRRASPACASRVTKWRPT